MLRENVYICIEIRCYYDIKTQYRDYDGDKTNDT